MESWRHGFVGTSSGIDVPLGERGGPSGPGGHSAPEKERKFIFSNLGISSGGSGCIPAMWCGGAGGVRGATGVATPVPSTASQDLHITSAHHLKPWTRDRGQCNNLFRSRKGRLTTCPRRKKEPFHDLLRSKRPVHRPAQGEKDGARNLATCAGRSFAVAFASLVQNSFCPPCAPPNSSGSCLCGYCNTLVRRHKISTDRNT